MNDQDQDRYEIEIRPLGIERTVWVVDSLAAPDVPPVKAYSGPDALLKATAEAQRLNSLAESGVSPAYRTGAGTWKPLPAFVKADTDTVRDALSRARQAEQDFTNALGSLAAEAEVLRRATDRLLRVRAENEKAPKTPPSSPYTAQDAYRVLGEALRDPEPQERSERVKSGAGWGHESDDVPPQERSEQRSRVEVLAGHAPGAQGVLVRTRTVGVLTYRTVMLDGEGFERHYAADLIKIIEPELKLPAAQEGNPYSLGPDGPWNVPQGSGSGA